MSELAPAAVYLLCLATSALCTALLARAWLTSRSRLLAWTSVSFAFLTVNNMLLVADLVLFTTLELWVWRQLAAGLALVVLLYAFVWESQ